MPIYTNFTGRGNHEIFKNDITHKKIENEKKREIKREINGGGVDEFDVYDMNFKKSKKTIKKKPMNNIKFVLD